MPPEFDYFSAFSRNLGWVTKSEQAILRGKRVAIAGLGGVGGLHLITMARLGIGAFHLAELDDFGIVNFNRQYGATLANIGRPKLDVMVDIARQINPELDVRPFPEGVSTANLDAFLDGVDLYLDGLDFFVLTVRQAVFAACARRGIPATTVAPLGMGAALINFLPGQMTFEDYFGFGDAAEGEKALRFFHGLAPSGLQMGYLVDPTTVDLPGRKGPSTPMGAMLCAGVAGTEALKILLGRGKVYAAPWGVHFDAYKNCLTRTWRPGGHRNPLIRMALALTRRRMGLPTP
jgi:molybdopterin/thiamine biosynthesis adenylyltransferase